MYSPRKLVLFRLETVIQKERSLDFINYDERTDNI